MAQTLWSSVPSCSQDSGHVAEAAIGIPSRHPSSGVTIETGGGLVVAKGEDLGEGTWESLLTGLGFLWGDGIFWNGIVVNVV